MTRLYNNNNILSHHKSYSRKKEKLVSVFHSVKALNYKKKAEQQLLSYDKFLYTEMQNTTNKLENIDHCGINSLEVRIGLIKKRRIF